MRNIVLFDDTTVSQNLLPLSFTRPVADMRVGITTIATKWRNKLDGDFSYLTADYLSERFPVKLSAIAADNIFIAGNVCPPDDPWFYDMLDDLNAGEAIYAGSQLVAFCGSADAFASRSIDTIKEYVGKLLIVNQLYDIFGLNLQAILADYARLDLSHSQELSDSCHVIGPREDADGRSLIYIAPGARVEGAFINTTNGPVYIGENAEVMEGSCLRGPVAICRNATVNMATKIYPATTIGPWCKVGGELNNVVIFGYSNKAHDGFLGNAVIGEWCNLGAGCVASNLKNDYSRVRLWNYPTQRFLNTDLQFCGLIMGDHSKAGINTMFNTATVVGVGCNVYGAGFPRTFIPSFSEGGAAGFSTVPLKKFFDIAERVMARRGRQLTDADRAIFETLYHAQ
jgi:UDP-N-acetylglucosamine diphosphorylase/glucosamine-1-phosphate N-acetyltransferase